MFGQKKALSVGVQIRPKRARHFSLARGSLFQELAFIQRVTTTVLDQVLAYVVLAHIYIIGQAQEEAFRA